MLTPSQRQAVLRLDAHDYSLADIVAITGYSRTEVRAVLFPNLPPERVQLIEVAQRLLQKFPGWWRGNRASYEWCVWMNFCDVLDSSLAPRR